MTAYDRNYSYDYPIMGKFWKYLCHYCGKDLRKAQKECIVKVEKRGWEFDEPAFERHWYCNKDCARAEYQEIARNAAKSETEVEKLNDYIKGRE